MQKKIITMTNFQMIKAHEALLVFKQPEVKFMVGQAQLTSDIKVLAGFRLAESSRLLESKVKAYRDYRNDMLRQYADLKNGEFQKKPDSNEIVCKSPEDETKARADAAELDNAQIELELWTFRFEELFKDINESTRPPEIWDDLTWMIEFEEKKEAG